MSFRSRGVGARFPGDVVASLTPVYDALARGESGLFFCVNGQSRSAAAALACLAPLLPQTSVEDVAGKIRGLRAIVEFEAQDARHTSPVDFAEREWQSLRNEVVARGLAAKHHPMVTVLRATPHKSRKSPPLVPRKFAKHKNKQNWGPGVSTGLA